MKQMYACTGGNLGQCEKKSPKILSEMKQCEKWYKNMIHLLKMNKILVATLENKRWE